MTFFNPECLGCQCELTKMADHGIGIASIMAVLRQWIPQVTIGGFPIEIETQISKLITYSLAIFILGKLLNYV